MKVLIFTSQFFEIGGIERLAVELAIDLNKHGIQADILSMYSETLINVKERKKELLKMGIPNIYFLGLKVHPSPISVLKATFFLNQLIRKNDYDIVETSSLTPIIIAFWGSKGTRCRQIVGIHQVFLKDRDNLFQHKILKWSISHNQDIRYYAVSQYAASKWIEYSNTSDKHSRCVYNSIHDDCFTINKNKDYLRKTFGLPDGSRIIIYVGRIIEPKRPDLIIDSLSGICEENNLAILFIGRIDLTVNGTEEMIMRMHHNINEKQLNHRIKFVGTSAEVPLIMASADLMVHPTQIEAFGLVLVEAMASGLQIVSTNVEGIPEVLKDTENIMVSPNNPDLLREAILITLNRTPFEIYQAVEKGRKRAELYRTSVRTKEMIKLFEDVLSKEF
jgi:glycosyltransferase involved in cell wall biosynthesis